MEDITNTQRSFKAASSAIHGNTPRQPLQDVSLTNARADQSLAAMGCHEKGDVAVEKAAMARSHILNQVSTPQIEPGVEGREMPRQVGIMQTPVAHFSFESPELLGQFSNLRR